MNHLSITGMGEGEQGVKGSLSSEYIRMSVDLVAAMAGLCL